MNFSLVPVRLCDEYLPLPRRTRKWWNHMFRHWRRIALAALVGAGTYGLATAGFAGAASAHHSAQLRVCNDASVTQTFHIDGTNQYGHTVRWHDRQIKPHSCITAAHWWWATGKI